MKAILIFLGCAVLVCFMLAISMCHIAGDYDKKVEKQFEENKDDVD